MIGAMIGATILSLESRALPFIRSGICPDAIERPSRKVARRSAPSRFVGFALYPDVSGGGFLRDPIGTGFFGGCLGLGRSADIAPALKKLSAHVVETIGPHELQPKVREPLTGSSVLFEIQVEKIPVAGSYVGEVFVRAPRRRDPRP